MREMECNTMVYWTLRGFCVWKLVGSLAGEMNVSFMAVVVVVGGSASALRDRRVCVEVFVIRVTSTHGIKSIGMFEDDVT